MLRNYKEPVRSDYDSEEEYLKAEYAYDQELLWQEQEAVERYFGSK